MDELIKHRERKIVEQAIYVLSETGGLDRFHLFKVMYYAERDHIAKWGVRMSDEVYCALEYGPVPSKLYDAIKEQQSRNKSWMGSLFWEGVAAAPDEAKGIMFAKREPDMGYISDSAKRALTKAIEQYARMDFGALSRLSHGLDWQRARKNGEVGAISRVDMAEAAGASTSVMELVAEMEETWTAIAD